MDSDLVLIHGFWSSPKTWEKLAQRFEADDDLRSLGVHAFPYESPKLSPLPFSASRIPDYNDIAQSLPSYLEEYAGRGNTAIVTHSQGGLILQRFLAWMLTHGRGRELSDIRLIVMLACPNEGTEYLRSIRAMAGLRRHPQARDLETLNADVAEARGFVVNHIVHASGISEHECQIPIYVYAGRTDRVVSRTSAQSFFPHAGSLPGNHLSILNPDASGNLTFPTLKRLLLPALSLGDRKGEIGVGRSRPSSRAANRAPVPPQAQQSVDPGTLKGVTSFFTGRVEQIAAIEAAVDSAQSLRDVHAIFVIHGMPGVGKTALALYVAHRLRERFSELARQVGLQEFACEVDLHGLEGLAQTDPEDALRRELLDDGVNPRQLSLNLEGLAAQWRRRMGRKFLILLLDNANDEEQVLPFLPGGSAHVVLVTSRRPLQGLVVSRGAATIDLPKLPPNDAVDLIKTVTARAIREGDQQAIEGIAEFCDYHPQAITITVAGLAGKSYISFAERLAQLKTVPNKLLAIDEYVDGESGKVARSFELSYAQLTDECQLVLRRLGLAPIPNISIEAAAALSNQAIATTSAYLRRLETEALIEEDQSGYHLHDLIRHYARSLADRDDPVENVAAVNRILAYYHDAATYVDSMLTRQPPPQAYEPPTPPVSHHFTDRNNAIAWARDELENFLACAGYVERGADGADRAEEKAWVIMFASALAGLLRNDGLWPQSIELQTRAITAARQLRLSLAEANALQERGQLYRLSGQLAEAVADLERALAIYREIGGEAGETGEAHALNTYAVVLDQLKRPTEAQQQLNTSLATYRRLGNRLGEANVLHDQGMAEYYNKHYAEAAELLSEALEHFQSVDHPLGQAHAHSNLAKAQRRVGLASEATHNLEAAQIQYQQLGNRLGEATTLTELGAVLREQGDYARAEETLAQTVGFNQRIGNQLGLAAALEELGALRADLGDLAGAEDLLTRSLELYREHGIRRDELGPLAKLRSLGLSGETTLHDE